ncbi:MAG TPA: TonB-dependent receptor [Candidatus Paraprevotella stercorigallinarum]|nr:TonB-dependent receptor [Candidatus Paraprevotella stercorigallinarum]
MKHKSIYTLITAALICGNIDAQNALPMLKGKVIDRGGETVIGAHVRWKNDKAAAVTDLDGNFTIPESGTELVVSFLGYKTQYVKVKPGQKNLVIRLEDDAQELDELVVIGYGTQKKSSLTGSIETIKSEDLLSMPTANLDEALYGQVAGLQVMQTTGDPSSAKEANLHIRGINNSPLLVIDGVPRFGTNTSDGEMRLSDLNPDDIESISILKDAAAAAVYGARAANGVILVQTKRATGNQKVSVNYRGQMNIQQATQLPEFLDAYNYALLYNKAVENTPGTTNTAYTPEQLEQIRTHSNPNLYGDEDLLDYLDNIGYSTTHSVSANGGNQFLKYYISGGYTHSQGLYSGVNRDRFNYSAKLDATLTKGLVLSLDIMGARTDSKNSSYTTIDAAYNFSPLQVLRFSNGYMASIDGSNPLINVEGLGGYIKDTGRMNTITANLKWELPWVKGLSMYARATFDNNNRMEKTFSKPVTLYTYDAQTGDYAIDPNTVYPTAKVTVEQTDRFVNNQLYEAGINYNRTFNSKHDVGAMLVANYQQTHNQYMTGENQNAAIYPEIIGTAVSARLIGSEAYNQRASLIGRLNYGYDYRYFIEASFRVDGSTYFHPDHRWGFFPSVSGSWVLSNEKFFKEWNQKVLSNVKFRASTGLLGDDGLVGEYAYLLTFMESTREGYNIGGIYRPGIVMNTGNYPNPELTWGKSHDYNIATDLGFWDNRFGLTFEYYWRFETDKITAAPSYLYPPSTGVSGNVPNMNFSKLKAWGWDLTLTHRNTIGKVKYNVDLTLAKSDDKYLDFGDESSVSPNLRRVGRSSMVWAMYEAEGLFQSQEEIDAYMPNMSEADKAALAPGDIKYKDQNNDGRLTTEDMIYVKNSSNPDFNFSIRLGASYKGFFINAMFQGATGYQQNIKELYTTNSGSLQRFQEYHLTDCWSSDNPNATLPRIKFATANDNNRKESTFWIRDCDFLRLKSLSIGYAFQPALLKKIKLNSASIALQGSNLLTWSSISDLGMDPESLRGYPIQRSYGITLNLGF